MWPTVILFVASIIISIVLAPKPENAKPASLADLDIPTAEDGRAKPIIFGKIKFKSPNNVWYGDLLAAKIEVWANKLTGKKQTVGYRYSMGMHNLCTLGAVDEITDILFDDLLAWSGSVTSNSTIVIDAENLFGGKDKEGGVSGSIDIEFGEAAQSKNTYLQDKIATNIPAYRNQFGLVFKAFYFGNTNYMKPLSVIMRRTDTQTDYTAQWNPTKARIGDDMNPIHIIRECLVSPVFGLNEPASKIDETSFAAAAATLYTESFGLSFVYDKGDQSISEFISDIRNMIDASLYQNLSDGKYYIKLIREDYNPATIPVFDENSIVELSDFTRPSSSELHNDVRVNFTSRTDNYSKRSALSLNIANINAQGRRIPKILDYYGIMKSDLASVIAARDLKQLSAGLFKCNVVGNRTMIDLMAGDVFTLQYSDWGITSVIVRVIDIDYGELMDNKITFSVVEDIFGINNAIYAPPADTGWADPVESPVDNTNAVPLDMTYFEAVKYIGQNEANGLAATDAYGMVFIPADQGQAYSYESWIDYAGGGYELASDDGSFTPHGTIDQTLSDAITDVSLTLVDFVGLDAIEAGTSAYCDGEYMKVKTINQVTGAVLLARGVLDTIPEAHATGKNIFFLGRSQYAASSKLVVGGSYNQKFLPKTSEGTLAIGSATSYGNTLSSRIYRPYCPANLIITGGGNNSIVMTWNNRNRLYLGSILEQADASLVAMEAGASNYISMSGVHSDLDVSQAETYTVTTLEQLTGLDLIVTGATTPATAGTYANSGLYNGEPTFTGGSFFIWWDGVSLYYISSSKGTPGAAYWTSSTAFGTYTAGGTAIGSPLATIDNIGLTYMLRSGIGSVESYSEWTIIQ